MLVHINGVFSERELRDCCVNRTLSFKKNCFWGKTLTVVGKLQILQKKLSLYSIKIEIVKQDEIFRCSYKRVLCTAKNMIRRGIIKRGCR